MAHWEWLNLGAPGWRSMPDASGQPCKIKQLTIQVWVFRLTWTAAEKFRKSGLTKFGIRINL